MKGYVVSEDLIKIYYLIVKSKKKISILGISLLLALIKSIGPLVISRAFDKIFSLISYLVLSKAFNKIFSLIYLAPLRAFISISYKIYILNILSIKGRYIGYNISTISIIANNVSIISIVIEINILDIKVNYATFINVFIELVRCYL